MGIFGRMKTLLKANVNDLTDKAENPELVLNQLILDMQDQLKQAKLEVRDTMTDEKRLKKKLDKALQDSQDWEKKAMSAVRAGRDSLAAEALARKQQHDAQASEYQASWEAQKHHSQELVTALRRLSTKIEEAKRKKASLTARVQRVEAQNAMRTTGASIKSSSAFDAFEQNAAKIEDFEVQVSAEAELSASFQENELESKFGKLEDTHGADDALADLKKKMGY